MKHYWCTKGLSEAMVSDKLTADECMRKCLELTNGQCQAVQYDEHEQNCAYCPDLDQIVRHSDTLQGRWTPLLVYKRGMNI
jgi:hypothetical protein